MQQLSSRKGIWAAEACEKWAGQTIGLVRQHQVPSQFLRCKKNFGAPVLTGREHGPTTRIVCTDSQPTMPFPTPAEVKTFERLCKLH